MGEALLGTLIVFSQLIFPLAQGNTFNDVVALGLESGTIPDSSLTASSEYDVDHGPKRARLNLVQVGSLRGAWSAKETNINQWIQVDLLTPHRIFGLATQGRQGEYSQWVTSFKIACSDDGVSFDTVQDLSTPGTDKVFNGNSDQDTVVNNTLPASQVCRYVRLLPLTWHIHISLRMELYGTAHVTVDAIPPEVHSCPQDQTFTAPVGTTTNSFTWTPPTATDAAGIQSIVSDHQPGVEVSVENPITVTYTVTDNNGLTNTDCSFTLSVVQEVDAIPPEVHSCPQNQTFTAPVGTTTISFTWTPPTATDAAGIQSIVSDHQPGVEVSVENPIIVTCTVTDNNGLTNTDCSFTLSVVQEEDTHLPVISACPSDQTLTVPVGTTTADSFTWTPPTASDVAGIQSIVSDYQPGVEVSVENPITVTYTVTDNNGLTNTDCSFTLSVVQEGTNKSFEADKAVDFEIKSVTGDKTVSVAFSKPFAVGVTALTTIYDLGDSAEENDNDVEGVEDHTDTKLVINSLVLDIVLVDEHGVQIVLGEGEEILLTFASSDPGGFKERICRYYDEDLSKWSGFGCYVQTSNATVVTCACNHTTSFAVLLQFEDCAIDGANLQIQTLMTRIFNSISIAALFLSVIIFTYLKLYKSDQVKVHICLAISLALAQLVMLFMGQTEHKGICRAIAGIMHYLLTAYCISMILEGTLLHRKACRAHKAPFKGWMVVLCVWGTPCVMVAVLMGSVIDGYGSECACWLNVQYGTMWIWLAEVCLVVVVNTVLLYLIMRTFLSIKANAKKSETDRLKATARALLIMMPMLGMTWVFALLQASFQNVFLQWFFILLNALQGPLFFVFQCVMHPEVKKVIGRKRKVGDSSKWAMNTSTSGTGQTESTDKGTSHST